MTPAESLPRCSFEGLEFPFESIAVRGGLRDAVHEYPHTPGGAPEKLGRKLYEIDIDATFITRSRRYPDLWPTTLDALIRKFERAQTGALMIPAIGQIQAYSLDWNRTQTNKILNGEKVQLKFREDQSGLFLVENLSEVTIASLEDQTRALIEIRAELTPDQDAKLVLDEDSGGISIFDALGELANAVSAIRDQRDLYANLLEAKLLALASMCKQIDETVDALDDPRSFLILDQIHEMWKTANDSLSGLRDRARLVPYVVPRRMSANDVSIAVYGSGERTVEILDLNPIEDAFQIPAGTRLRLYQAA